MVEIGRKGDPNMFEKLVKNRANIAKKNSKGFIRQDFCKKISFRICRFKLLLATFFFSLTWALEKEPSFKVSNVSFKNAIQMCTIILDNDVSTRRSYLRMRNFGGLLKQ